MYILDTCTSLSLYVPTPDLWTVTDSTTLREALKKNHFFAKWGGGLAGQGAQKKNSQNHFKAFLSPFG